MYSLDGVPALFDPSGKGDVLVPTAMALWRAPALLPPLRLKHPAVSQFIVGAAHGRHGHGADVMLPGVDVGSLPPFAKGDLVAVVVPGARRLAVPGAALRLQDRMCGKGARGGRCVRAAPPTRGVPPPVAPVRAQATPRRSRWASRR